LMHRGYYARVAAFSLALRRFVALGGRQIISLGAGFDTAFFRLVREGACPDVYVEVDLPQVTRNKTLIVKKTDELLRSLEDVSFGVCEIHSKRYHLVSADLRSVEAIQQAIKRTPLSSDQPTLIIAECVLIYLPPQDSRQLLEHLFQSFKLGPVIFMLYEQIIPNDSFGTMMCANLLKRGCPLLGIDEHPDLNAQKSRFRSIGCSQVDAFDMNAVWSQLLDKTDIARAQRLEIFDEYEEWYLIESHYCIVVAVSESPSPFSAETLFSSATAATTRNSRASPVPPPATSPRPARRRPKRYPPGPSPGSPPA